MLINRFNDSESHVKFISYTGRYPNLCSGVLTLEVDGKEYRFGHDYTVADSWKTDGNHDRFWSSGGTCGFNNGYSDEYVKQGEWAIDVSDLPDELKKYAAEIDCVFNCNVRHGCCGGCL